MRRVAQDDLDYERQNLLRQASEASKTIERIKRTIEVAMENMSTPSKYLPQKDNIWLVFMPLCHRRPTQRGLSIDPSRHGAQFSVVSTKFIIDWIYLRILSEPTISLARPEYLREYEILFTQMQKLHESLQDKATYALLRKQRIQPTNPFLPMPTIPGQPPRPTPVMEYLRTKPIEEIQEEIHEIEKKAREKTSSGKDEKGEEDEGKEGLKKLTVRIDGYNAECDRMDKIMGNWNAEQLKSDVSRIMQRETKTSNMTRPPPELQKLVDIPLNGDEVRAKRGKNSKKRMANLHQDLI
eukprot:jgi/Bigna1/74869/fgenesh1_pg.31_\